MYRVQLASRDMVCLSTAHDNGPGTLVRSAVKEGEMEVVRNDSAGRKFVPPFHSNDNSVLSKCSDDEVGAKQCHCLRVAFTMELSRTTKGTLPLLTNTILVNVPRIKTVVSSCGSTNVYFHATF
jgi:hypothetical protein